jgi:branched-chain amino acid transport system substrate-binding protein
MREGVQFAVDDINAQGGIMALGGAKLELVIADTGGTVETAVSATQRVLGAGDITAAIGAWLSSFTLATTEVSERLQIPWLTYSFADSILARGYKYVFRDDAPASVQVAEMLKAVKAAAAAEGREIRTVAFAGDNTASATDTLKALRAETAKQGLVLAEPQVWTPPLANPLQVALAVKQANPDVVLNAATTSDDTVALIRALRNVELPVPIIGFGASFITTDFAAAVGPEDIEGVATVVGAGLLKGQEALNDRFVAKYGHIMISNMLNTYAEVWVLKEALELAASADPVKVRDALAAVDITTGPAKDIPGGGVNYDETGQNTYASIAIQQWQNGQVITVAPVEQAAGTFNWGR